MEACSLKELLILVSKGSTGAFKELFNRYKEKILVQVHKRLSDSDEAKDITQDVFLYLWLNREKLSSLTDFDSYLYVIIRNKVISFFRRNTSRMAGEKFLLEGIDKLDSSAEELMLAKELQLHIEQTVAGLSITVQQCLQLSRTHGKKNSEIAAELNLSEQTVRNYISEALKHIRSNLAGKYSELFFLISVIMFTNAR